VLPTELKTSQLSISQQTPKSFFGISGLLPQLPREIARSQSGFTIHHSE
jgi:hypothetical protein